MIGFTEPLGSTALCKYVPSCMRLFMYPNTHSREPLASYRATALTKIGAFFLLEHLSELREATTACSLQLTHSNLQLIDINPAAPTLRGIARIGDLSEKYASSVPNRATTGCSAFTSCSAFKLVFQACLSPGN